MKNNNRTRVGSKEQYGPRLAGAVLHDYLANSNEPLAVAYHEQKTPEAQDDSDQLFRDFYPNTELSVDLKLITRKPGRMSVGDSISCMLTRDEDYHYTAVENAIEGKASGQRNPHIYKGKCINVSRRYDGKAYPTFTRPRYTKDFKFQDFCREAAEELLLVAGLLEEK